MGKFKNRLDRALGSVAQEKTSTEKYIKKQKWIGLTASTAPAEGGVWFPAPMPGSSEITALGVSCSSKGTCIYTHTSHTHMILKGKDRNFTR